MKKLFYYIVVKFISLLAKNSSLFCQIFYENSKGFFLVPIFNDWERQKWVHKKDLNFELRQEVPQDFKGTNFDYLCEIIEHTIY